VGSGSSGNGAEHPVDVYVTLHHTGDPNEDVLINVALVDSIYGSLHSLIIFSIF
jgi:hypothetical protein